MDQLMGGSSGSRALDWMRRYCIYGCMQGCARQPGRRSSLQREWPLSTQVVGGLSCALSKGWSVHHGVAKFAANALTMLCICETAAGQIREFAIDETIQGLSEWLQKDDEAKEVDEVCGCNCGCAALSATCWLEVPVAASCPPPRLPQLRPNPLSSSSPLPTTPDSCFLAAVARETRCAL